MAIRVRRPWWPLLLAMSAVWLAPQVSRAQASGSTPAGAGGVDSGTAGRAAGRTSLKSTAVPRDISLAEAVRIAISRSEAVQIAEAGIVRARGQVAQARALFFPQLSGTAGYTRTLQTQYSSFNKAFGGADTTSAASTLTALCAPHIDSLTTPAQRQAAFNAAQSCPAGANGLNFSSVGFGALNQFTVGLNFSQTLFNGQVLAQNQAVSSPRRSAEIEVRAQRAQVTYDATQAYYDAALADRLVTIAESTLVESDRTFRQAQLGQHVGTQSDFDLLQAQVTRNNQVPIVIQRRSDRDIAYYRLKQLLKLSLDAPLSLATDVEDSTAAPDGLRLSSLSTSIGSDGVMATTDSLSLPLDTAAEHRSTFREQVETVKEEDALHRVALAERLPSLNLTSQYQRVAYPVGFPSLADFLTNWNVGVGLSIPIFSGGRIKGDILVAQANLIEAKARLQQTRELAALDSRTAIATFRQADAAWMASVGTVSQATKAYEIAELRYREGISTQTELNDQRIAQQQALANRAQAARNLQVARVRLALIADLPLTNTEQAGISASQSASQGSSSSATAAQQAAPQQGTGGTPGVPRPPGAPGATGTPGSTTTTSGQSGSSTP